MNQQHDLDETLDLMHSIRDSLRDLTCRAKQQNASLRSSYSTGFISPMPTEDESPDASTQEYADPRDFLT